MSVLISPDALRLAGEPALSCRAQWRRIASGTRGWFRAHPSLSAAGNIVRVGMPGPEAPSRVMLGRLDADRLRSDAPGLAWEARRVLSRGNARALWDDACMSEAAIVSGRFTVLQSREARRLNVEEGAASRRAAALSGFRPAWG